MKNIIEFGKGITYLNEVTEYKLNGILIKDKFSLPNGIFNKVLTGCGGTTIALEDSRNTIICSPRITLLKNKHEQYPNTMLVIGRINKSEIANYINSIDIPKILVTYDSLYKVLDIITDMDNWHIVVDEFQCILTDSSLKSVTEMNFLYRLTRIKNITFMSATPLLNKYTSQMDILKDMPYYECKFTDTYKVNVFRRKVNKPINKGIEIIEMYQKGNFPALETGETSREAVIYLNSVNNIISLIKTTKLQSNDVNIICAENEDNRTKIKKSLGNGFDIGRIPLKGEKPKLITLCTSTAYFGVDMYSDNALTFVISDCNKINTTVDISTELVQIAGRLRNADNPFRYYIYFIYNTNREELDDAEFNNMIDTKTTVTLQEIENYNNAPKELKEKLVRDNRRNISIMKFEDSYTYYTGTKFAFNKMAYLNDIFVYDTQRNNYQDGIAVKKSINETRNLQTLGNQKFSVVTKQLDIITGNESFEDLMKSYCEAKENKYSFAIFYIEQKDINIKHYYDILGSKRIKSLSYKESNLKNEIRNRSNDSKVIHELDKLNINTFIECSKLKLILQDIYNKLGLKKTAKATDITKYYVNSILASKRINGKKCKGYELYK